LLLRIHRYYKLKEKKTIFENKRKEKKKKRDNDLADLPSHDSQLLSILHLSTF